MSLDITGFITWARTFLDDIYQSKLVSGTNIKTINNNSLLGSGNISISSNETVDNTVTENSSNPVKSSGIYSALSNKADKNHNHPNWIENTLDNGKLYVNDELGICELNYLNSPVTISTANSWTLLETIDEIALYPPKTTLYAQCSDFEVLGRVLTDGKIQSLFHTVGQRAVAFNLMWHYDILDTLTLTTNNNILSYANSDTATLTATHSGGSGKTVQLYDASDDSLIGTMTDNNDGTYSYTYNSQGIGDLEVYAKSGSLVSETYSIQDCYFYDSFTSDNSRFTLVQGTASLEYSNTGLKYTGTATTDCIHQLNMELPNGEYTVECDVTALPSSGYSSGIGTEDAQILKGNSGLYARYISKSGDFFNNGNASTPFHLLIEVTGSTSKTIKYYRNDSLLGTGNNVTQNKQLRLRSYSGRYITIKDFKIKPLTKTFDGISLSVDESTIVYGESVTLTAQLTSDGSPVSISDGTVSFYDGETLIGSEDTDSTGVATFTSSNFDVGSHSVTGVCDEYTSNSVSVTVNKLPLEYQEVEYIENTGTSYIDTGFKPNNNTRTYIRFYAGTLGTNVRAIFGSRDATTYNDSYTSFYLGSNTTSTGRMRVDYYNTNSNNVYLFPNTSDKTEYELDYNKNIVTLNGATHTFTPQTFNSNNNIFLFTCNNGGIADNRMMIGKIYACKIWDNEVLIRNLIPCYRISDNVIGLYDIVNDVFYTNSGTGTFSKGADV